ncbi:unnamed protein product [Amoebophrya sp. A25]|nr:unnamed protein product [Amoebophrya sp. A25]|eukprot:GSA25T00023788001.1
MSGEQANGNGVADAPGAAAVSTNMDSGVAAVWNVVSGDQFEICMGVNKGHVELKKIAIAGVTAPRMGLKSLQVDTKDEPFAWESKEYLRKMLLAKKVQFRKLYTSQSGALDYYEVRIAGEKTHVGLKLLSAGMVKVAPGNQVKGLPFYSDLEQAETEARSQALGVHASTGTVRDLAAAQDFPEDFLAQNKGKLRPCIVDYIRDAGTYRVVCLPTEDDPRYVSAQILLSGVQNPTFRREAGGVEIESKPGNGAFFARAFAIERILGREMSVHIESIQRQGGAGAQTISFLGSLIHPAKGSITEFFLDAGFGQYVDWSAAKSYSGPDALQAAQKRAQDARKGRWKNWDGKQDSLDSFEFTGKVVEVLSGDVMRIVNTETPERQERRYYLASVRGPQRLSPWNAPCIEFLRKKCIGKQFKVRLEYKKNISVFGEGAHPPPSNEETQELYFVSLLDSSKKNVIVDAVEAGMVMLQQNMGGPDSMNERSRDFDALQEADAVARAGMKGQHGGDAKAPKPPAVTELVLQQPGGPKGRGPTTKKELSERAKSFEAQLVASRSGHDAVVTYLMNGSRMRLRLTNEKITLNFQMNGVRAPNAEKNIPAAAAANVPKPEPFGNESLQLARELCMQQDVKVVIDRVDPAGTFQGTLYLLKGNGRQDMAMVLLEKGLAYCDQWCNNSTYWGAEGKAKNEKLNYWSLEHEAQAVVEVATAAGTPIQGKITQVNSLDSFYVVPSGGADLKIQNELALNARSFADEPQPQKRNVYAVQYWEDKKWYRGRLEGKGSEGLWSFSFIDFGFIADVDNVKRIQAGSSLLSTPAVAQHCGLYGIKTNDEFWEDACGSFFKKTDGKTVSGTIEIAHGGVQYVTLFVAGACVNEALVKDSVARLTRKQNKPSNIDYATWKAAETAAKRTRAKLWRYGDVGSDDEEY